jgi:XRN 5'-3' exonuclease N-terminus
MNYSKSAHFSKQLLYMFLYIFGISAFLPLPVRNINRNIFKTELSGIKGFRSWFESQFPDAIRGISSKGSQEYFDHVLIDINQLLHIAVRRSSSEDHALAILMRELNACVELATPTKSLVLAMDGPPSAAKLATSRKRRLTTLSKTHWKLKLIERIQKSPKIAMNSSKEKRLRQRCSAEIDTLCITPGTTFMDKANQALLFWSWQRMVSNDGPLSKVSIYISASNAAGEGEVKILDWILRKRAKGTLAILGGDSDLVLEGLVIPPSICTHNVFVLLPDIGKRYLVVSLWETTRHISQLLPQLRAQDILRIRTDMVLLLILNGNDYLPKLRGSSGFNRVFRTYIQAVREWLEEGKNNPFLVDPDSLNFHLEFAIDFFGRLKLERPLESAARIAEQQSNVVTPLGQLNNLLSTNLLPKPMRWTVITEGVERQIGIVVDRFPSSDEYDDDHDDDDITDFTFDDIDESAEKGDEQLTSEDDEENRFAFENVAFEHSRLRLTLGKLGSTESLSYEVTYSVDSNIKECKNALAKLAIDDLLGKDYLKSENNAIHESSYAWDLSFPVESDCKLYLGGLLWNLQTYQDGICSDYGYNYGKRLSPSAEDLVEYFQDSLQNGSFVGKCNLLPQRFTPPLKNGVSCLAALPSQMANLIAEPYSSIPKEVVEEFYADCVSTIDNSFDIQAFSSLCEAEIAKLKRVQDFAPTALEGNLKNAVLGEDYWTVVFRSSKVLDTPFLPPTPVIDKFTPLFINRRIKVSRYAASTEPRRRTMWESMDNLDGSYIKKGINDIDFCGMHELLLIAKDGCSVFDVDYFKPYDRKRNAEIGSMESLKKGKEILRDDLRQQPTTVSFNNQSETYLTFLLKFERLGLLRSEWKIELRQATSSRVPCELHSHTLSINQGNLSEFSTCFLPDGAWTFRLDGSINGTQQIKENLAALALNKILETHQTTRLESRQHNEVLSLLDDLARSLSDFDMSKLCYQIDSACRENCEEGISDSEIICSETISSKRQRIRRLSNQQISERLQLFRLEIDPVLHPSRSKHGISPIDYLIKLEEADMVDLEWRSTFPSKTDFASISPNEFECIELIIRKGDSAINSTYDRELIFQRDREKTRGSKQQVKAYLASLALSRLLTNKNVNWFDLTVKEVKDILLPDYEITTDHRLSNDDLKKRMIDFGLLPITTEEVSVTGKTALEYLRLLQQDNFIEMRFDFMYPSPSELASISPKDFELVVLTLSGKKRSLRIPLIGDLIFQRDRLTSTKRKKVKQYLASLALSYLLQQEKSRWSKLTYKELKAILKAPSRSEKLKGMSANA